MRQNEVDFDDLKEGDIVRAEDIDNNGAVDRSVVSDVQWYEIIAINKREGSRCLKVKPVQVISVDGNPEEENVQIIFEQQKA